MRQDNINLLQDTLETIDRGGYMFEGKWVSLKLTQEQREAAEVFLPKDVEAISACQDLPYVNVLERCKYSCVNEDSFKCALKRQRELADTMGGNTTKRVLVLNLANPVHPGGGVRNGAQAQEEDLCRKSTLLLSLESQNALPYYKYNRSLHTYMGSDAIMIHPNVEVFKDELCRLIEVPVTVAVMTCAAPMLRNGMEGLSQEEYEAMLYRRITGMLKVAAYRGYQYLVLGAFGCGAFRNDARVVSDIFCKALQDFDFCGMKDKDFFRTIDFAVMDHSDSQYNFKEFSRNFANHNEDENRSETGLSFVDKSFLRPPLDEIRGCLYGGAVGDALGYPVEFLPEEVIFSQYGPDGITAFEKDPYSKKALISDDTQMTMFTANGLIAGDTHGCMNHMGEWQDWPRFYVARAYLDWFKTQEYTMEEVTRHRRLTKEGGYSWLLDVPEMYSRRAPGKTCLSALECEADGQTFDDYVKAARNTSKGCGGVMRVAPLAVNYHTNIEQLDMEAAQLAAITHGHSLGYMPAAVLVHVINRIVFPPDGEKVSLKDIIIEARDTVAKLFASDPKLPVLKDIINRAVRLAEDGSADDLENIHQLGEGWVAEEALAISLYCALKYQNDFSKGVITAVNHSGDSDSTGAITGNILGALLGYNAMEEKWKKDLELADVILELADDMCEGCQMSNAGHYRDDDWEQKYIVMHRVEDVW